MEQRFGADETDCIFYDSGYLAGQHFFQNVIGNVDSFEAFIKRLQSALHEFGVGVLRVEEADMEKGEFVITVSEDLDCSGLPEAEEEICTYDEGFIAALLECFSGKKFQVKEIDCWCTGDRTCRFVAKAAKW